MASAQPLGPNYCGRSADDQSHDGILDTIRQDGQHSGPGLPPWPKYDAKTDQVQELGHEVKQRPIPHGDRFPLFERSLNRRLALLGKDQAGAAQTK